MRKASSLVRLPRGRRLAMVWGPTILVLVFGGLAYWANLRERESRSAMTESYQVIERLQVLLTRLVDAETGQRGYVLTGRPSYVRPYLNAKADVQRHLTELRTLMRSEPQQARLDSLAMVVGAKFGELEETIQLRDDGSLEDVLAVVATDRGMETMARARELTARIRRTELNALARRSAREERNSFALGLILVLGSLLAAGGSLLLSRLMDDYATTQERIASDLEVANDQLLLQQEELETQNQHLQEQSLELEMQAEQLQDQSAELQAQNAQLSEMAEELEARTAAAEEANRAKADFLAAMSHDLRTPLNAITGYVGLLEMGVHGPLNDAQLHDLQRIRSSNGRLMALITDILSFARLEAGKVEVTLRPVRLDAAMRDVEASFLPQVDARGLTYQYEGCDPDLAVEADLDRMEQIVLNLITNAIKFTEPGGTITSRVVMQEGVLVQISDTGTGIPADRLRDIFEPFVQVDGKRTDQYHGGVGLGLAICRKLARAMGGDISATSEEGVGSCFTLRLRPAELPNLTDHDSRGDAVANQDLPSTP